LTEEGGGLGAGFGQEGQFEIWLAPTDRERRTKQMCRRVLFGAQFRRNFHHEHIPNHSAADSGHHAGRYHRNGPRTESERLVRAGDYPFRGFTFFVRSNDLREKLLA